MKFLKISIILLLFSSQSFAQFMATGKVTDIENLPVSFANVILKNASDSSFVTGTVTNDAGEFLLEDLENKSYFISISNLNYAVFNTKVFDFEKGQLGPFNIQMVQSAVELEALTVIARKPLIVQKLDRTVVNIENSIVATGSDALKVLERSPGVQIDKLNNEIQILGKNGVVLMVDGKSIRMTGEAALQFLQSIPSDNLVSIEIITSPSAAYDAEGEAGVINIITKKQSIDGYSANFNLNTGYGSRPKLGGNFNINWRKNKLMVFASASARQNWTREDVNIDSRIGLFEDQTRSNLYSNRPVSLGLYNSRIGLDYAISEKGTLGFQLTGNIRKWIMDAETTTTIDNDNAPDFSTVLDIAEDNTIANLVGNVSYRHQYSTESFLNLNFDFLTYQGDNPTNYVQEIYDVNGNLSGTDYFDANKSTPVNFYVFSADYSKTISKSLRMEMGLKASTTTFVNDVRLTNKIQNEAIDHPQFTDLYELDEKLGAVYTTAEYRPSQKIVAKLGLRYEYYDSDLTSKKEGGILLQSFGRLFPFASVSYKISDEQSISAVYTKRISRPSIFQIAPAFILWGYNSYLGGNPDLVPAISHIYTVKYQAKQYQFQLEYMNNDNAFAWQPIVNLEDKTILNRFQNVKNSHSFMAALSFPVRLTNWWEGRFNTSYFWQTNELNIGEDNVQLTNRYFILNANNSFSMRKGFSLELLATYDSGRRRGLGLYQHNLIFNVGLQKKFESGSTITLNWTDPFNIGSQRIILFDVPQVGYYYDWRYDSEGSVINLNFSYNLGNTKLKTRKSRKTGSEEEQKRVL